MATNFGRLKSWGHSALNYAKDIAGSGNVGEFLNTYIKPTEEELAEVAKRTLLKENTISERLSQEKIIETANAVLKDGNITNQNYNNYVNQFKQHIKNNDVDKARIAANKINEEFNRGEFIDLLSDKEKIMKSRADKINNSSNEDLRNRFSENASKKITNNKIVGNFIDSETAGNIADKYLYTAQGFNPKTYFSTPDKKKNAVRAGTALGTYAAGANIVRLAQGGNPIRDQYGERDIAGVPFI